MRLVFVHGRDQQGKDAEGLSKSWSDALDIGLAAAKLARLTNVPVSFPYYGDTLLNLVKQLDTPLVEEVATKGGPPDDREAAFRGELLRELADNAGVTEQMILDEAPAIQERGPLNWPWVHSILRALDNRAHFGDGVLDTFTRDVFVYLTYPAVADQINAIVTQDVQGDGPCVVVAHSLGTIVAYRVLSELGAKVDVRAFITAGSPLGLQAVRNHLEAPLAKPAGVKVWKNAFDTRDVVALKPLDGTTWPIKPLIENYGQVKNKTDNRHGISGYLDDATVAGWISAAAR